MARTGDVTWPIALSLSEALRGCSRIVYFPRREVPCRRCLGTGEVASGPCDGCEGTGWAEIIKRVPVDLPPVPDHCARVRIAGAGEYVEETGGFGDLSLVCHVAPHEDLSLVAGELRATLRVPTERASAGGVFTVNLPTGPLEVELPGPLSDGQWYDVQTDALDQSGQRRLLVEVAIVGERAEHSPDAATISRLYADASNAERARDFERARDLYARVAQYEPSPRALRKCGWMHLRLDDYDRAITYLAEAVEANWESAESHYYKGAVHYKRREPVQAAVEVELARQFGMHEPQMDVIRERSLHQLFQPPEGLSASERELCERAAAAATRRYYGSAMADLREVLESVHEARLYYQYAAACWLLSIDGDQDHLAEAYLALRAALSMAPDDEEIGLAFRELDRTLATRGSVAAQAAVAGHLLRRGEACAAWRHVDAASRGMVAPRAVSDREASAADEVLQSALVACDELVAAMQPAHGVWTSALARVSAAAARLREMAEELTDSTEPTVRSAVRGASREASELGREGLLGPCAALEAHLERDHGRLPPLCHAWLEQLIASASQLKSDVRSLVRGGRSDHARVNGSVAGRMEAVKQLAADAAALEQIVSEQFDTLDGLLCHALQCWSRMLHMRSLVSQRIGRDDHLLRCQSLAKAVRLAELARSMRPDAATDLEQRQATCDLLDDFQEAAQDAAGTGAFARAEFFQNTIDSLRADVLPTRVLAESVSDFLQESRLQLFDWACDVLFASAGSLPQEFLVDARPECYALTNYRIAHRQIDATTYVLIPLSSVQRYDIRASGATTCIATFTLKDGRRLTFNRVPNEDVVPADRLKWLLGARMWATLTEAELEALDRGQPAPTAQLPAEAAHDRRRLLGDTRQAQLGSGADTTVCAHCGRHNFAQDRFCRECGARLAAEADQALPTERRSALSEGRQTEEGAEGHALP